MNKFIVRCLASLAVLVTALTMVSPAAADQIPKPPGVKLVKVSECVINWGQSVYWTGRSENVVLQLVWLSSQLPEECLERKCVFTNIDQVWFLRLVPRFLEGFEHDPRLRELRSLIVSGMKDCRIEMNTPLSIGSVGGEGSLSCGDDGNTLVLSISGNNNTFSSSQVGCNFGEFHLKGNNITVTISQFGQNTAVVNISGNNIVFTLDQKGENTYNNTFNSPGVYHASQSN